MMIYKNVQHILLTILLAIFPLFSEAASKIIIAVSVDWEGEELNSENLKAMQNFRKKYPEIKMQHFLNPAYYTEGIEDTDHPDLITQKINSVLIPGDEQGMHMHGWRQFFESSNVQFISSPNFIDNSDDRQGVRVPLWAYSSQDLTKVFKHGVDVLVSHGFSRPKIFRAGGWQASSEVIEALYNSGFEFDASSVSAAHLGYWANDNLGFWVKQLWPDVSLNTQPYLIGNSTHQMIELPNNGCLADYVTGEEMLNDFKTLANDLAQNPNKDLYFSIGFHQETAARFIGRLETAISLIKKYAQKNQVPYEFAKFPLSDLKKNKNSLNKASAVSAALIENI